MGAGQDDGAAAGRPASGAPRQLWEREAALEAISSLLVAARSGRGGVLFVAGDAGLGKTALARRAAAMASGFTVVTVEASSAEATLPFGVAAAMLASLGGSAEVVEADAGAERASRFYRAMRTLAEAAKEAAVLVVVDDLHWADQDSLDLLGFCCRRLAGLSVAVLGTTRPWPEQAVAMAGELVGSDHARLVELAPLSEDATAEILASALATTLPPGRVGALHRACGGNPLLLQAAAASLLAGDDLGRLGPSARLGAGILLSRFAGVGEMALRYAQGAAIFGPRFRSDLVGPLAGLGSHDADAALVRLCRAGLVVEVDPGWVGFVHPQFAQALAEDFPAPVRASMHAAAFALLDAAGVDPAEAAPHARAASLVGDPAAIACLERAGRTALAQGALAAAAAHLSGAVTLAGTDPPDGLILILAETLVAQARIAEAAELCNTVLARRGVGPGARVDALRVLASAALASGRPDELQARFEDAIEVARADPARRVRVLADAAVSCMFSVPPRWIATQVAEARRLLPVGVVEPASLLGAAGGHVAVLGGDPSGIEDVVAAARAFDADASSADSGWGWMIRLNVLNVAKTLERFEEAEAAFTAGYRHAEQVGSPVTLGFYAVAQADTLHRLGRLGEALSLIDRAERLAAAFGFWNPWGGLSRAALLDDAGRPGEAAAAAEQVQQAAGPHPDFYPILWMWLWLLEARRHLAAGQPELAAAAMDRTAKLAGAAGIVEPCVVPWAPVAIPPNQAAGRIGDATGVVVALEGVVEPLPCRWPRAVAAVGRARLAEIA
ncbi:MAG: AAA family ATPase, partial [Acidimicrobiales bacterium]